jgi:hypothetical protein
MSRNKNTQEHIKALRACIRHCTFDLQPFQQEEHCTQAEAILHTRSERKLQATQHKTHKRDSTLNCLTDSKTERSNTATLANYFDDNTCISELGATTDTDSECSIFHDGNGDLPHECNVW